MRTTNYQIETHRNLTYKILEHQYDNPTECYDLLGTVNVFSRRYSIGHEHDYDTKSDLLLCLAINYNDSVEEIENDEERINRIDGIIEENYVILDLYLYDHSGQSISTSPYSCIWDSGHAGYVYADFDKIKKWFKVDEITEEIKQRAIEVIEGEIKELDRWVRGDTYFEGAIRHNDEWVDWVGCYDTYEDAEQAAKDYVKHNSVI